MANTTYTGVDIFSDSLKARQNNINNVYDLQEENEDYEPDEDHDEDEEPF